MISKKEWKEFDDDVNWYAQESYGNLRILTDKEIRLVLKKYFTNPDCMTSSFADVKKYRKK